MNRCGGKSHKGRGWALLSALELSSPAVARLSGLGQRTASGRFPRVPGRRGTMFDVAKYLSELGGATVLCIGDLMLDTYVYGEVTRVSPEAPALVIAAKREDV